MKGDPRPVGPDRGDRRAAVKAVTRHVIAQDIPHVFVESRPGQIVQEHINLFARRYGFFYILPEGLLCGSCRLLRLQPNLLQLTTMLLSKSCLHLVFHSLSPILANSSRLMEWPTSGCSDSAVRLYTISRRTARRVIAIHAVVRSQCHRVFPSQCDPMSL